MFIFKKDQMNPAGTKRGYRSVPLSFTRKMVIASISGNKKKAIHYVTEIVDGAPAARFMKQYAKLVESGSLLNSEEISDQS